MTNQDYIGRAMRARIHLDLPTRHKVAPGETFRYLQAHLDGGASAVLWVKCGQVELLDDPVALPIPAEPVGPGGRRRERHRTRWDRPAEPAVTEPEPAPVDDVVTEDTPTDTAADAAGGE